MEIVTSAERNMIVSAVMSRLGVRLAGAQADALSALNHLGATLGPLNRDAVYETCAQAVGMALTETLREIDDAPPDVCRN